MRRAIFIAIMAIAPMIAAAEDAEILAEERDALFEVLGAADSDAIASAATRAIWEHWMIAPDEDAQALLDLGLSRMQIYDNVGAIEVFDQLTEYAPDYPEGWNQRAFAKFRMDDFEGSLADIDEVMAREPKHFGALMGRFRILMAQGRATLAQDTLRKAVEINPMLSERVLLLEPR